MRWSAQWLIIMIQVNITFRNTLVKRATIYVMFRVKDVFIAPPFIMQRKEAARGRKRTNKHKYKCVWWESNIKRWRTKITIKGKTINLGCFITENEAAEAYNAAALKYHGEFAKLNEIIS